MLAQLCSLPRPCTKTNSRRNPPEQTERSPFKAFQGSASSFSSSSAGRALLPPGAGSWGAKKEKKNTTEHSPAGYGALAGWGRRGGPVLRAYSGRRAAGGAQGGPQPLQLRRQLLAGRDAGAEVPLPGLQQAPQPPQPLHLRAAENSGSRRGGASRAGPGLSRSVPPSGRQHRPGAAPARSPRPPPCRSLPQASLLLLALPWQRRPEIRRGCFRAEAEEAARMLRALAGMGRGGEGAPGPGPGPGLGRACSSPLVLPGAGAAAPTSPRGAWGGSRGEAEAAAGPGLRGGGRLRGP